MRILFLSRWYPFPPTNGSKLRVFNLLDRLSEVGRVDLITFDDRDGRSGGQDGLRDLCQTVAALPYREYAATRPRAIVGLMSTSPRFITYTYQEEMETAIRRALASAKYDLIIASQWEMASYRDAFTDLPAIFEEVELGAFLSKKDAAENPLARARHGLTLLKMKSYSRRLIPRFDACTVASDLEAENLRNFVPDYDQIHVVPNCIRLEDYQPGAVPKQDNLIIFTGSLDFDPNYQAMDWFCKAIYPLVLEEIPDAKLMITGRGNGRELPSVGQIERTGHVDDIRPLLASARVALAPILSGGGTRLKILEAMALKTPVVSTFKGAEGLGVEHARHMLLADDPRLFAEQVVKILRNPDWARRLAAEAYRFAKVNASCRVSGSRLIEICQRILSENPKTSTRSQLISLLD